LENGDFSVATIRERNGQWQVQVRLVGCGLHSKTFAKYADAKAWGLEQERKLKLGYVPTEWRKELQSVTIESLIEWYRQDRTLYPPRRKGSYDNEDVALQLGLWNGSTAVTFIAAVAFRSRSVG
jgi:hypothetical protein